MPMSKLDAPFRPDACIALGSSGLYLDRAAHSVDHAAKFDKEAVAGALDDAPMMRGDRGVNQIVAQPPQPRQRAIFIRSSQPAVADNIGDQDRCNFPGLAHGAPSHRSP
jgi:hypothetical protein